MPIAIATLCLAGLVDGILEGYGFDGRKSLERKFGVPPTSYFGSQSWKRAYVGNNTDLGFKPGIVKWLGAFDFYHHADDLRKLLYLAGGMLATTLKFNFFAVLIGAFLVSGIAKSLGMKWIRK